MAKGVSKKGQIIEIVSTQLEEFIPIKFVIVGTPAWLDSAFEQDALDAAFRILRVTDDLQMHRVLEWLDKHVHHFIDTETTGEDKRSGLDPWHPKSKLLMMQIGNADLVFIVDPALVHLLKSHLENPAHIHVFQNGVFDWKYIQAKLGIHINHFYDTMLSEQLLTSGRSLPVNLAAIARRRPPYRIISKAVRKEFVEFKGKFTKEMVYYAARDIVLLPPIMEDQLAILKKLDMEVVANDEFNLIPVTGSMELGGVPFSTKTLRLALLYWEERQLELEAQILHAYDQRMNARGANKGTFEELGFTWEFDVGSNAQKLAALRELGLKKGDELIEDVKRDTLDEINDPIAELLGQYSECVKITSTYGQNMIDRINPETKRLQVEFNQLGHGDMEKAGKATTIATGRYSSDFQQLPKAMNRYSLVKGPELLQVQALFHSKINQLLEEAGQHGEPST